MITLRKLSRMQNRVCVKKLAIITHDASVAVRRGERVPSGYLLSLFPLLEREDITPLFSEQQRAYCLRLKEQLLRSGTPDALVLEDLSALLFKVLGAEPSDWDFTGGDGKLDFSKRVVCPRTLVLDRVRSPFNVGSIFRCADSFAVGEIILVEGCADCTHPRAVRTSRGTVETVSHRVMSAQAVCDYLRDKKVFALELGGVSDRVFPFPEEGVCVIGSEEMGVSAPLLNLCDASLGRVSIPLYGTKGSLNVSVATGIMLHSWMEK